MLSFLLFHRRTQILAVGWKFLGAISIFVVGTVPYAIHNRIWYRPDMAAAPLSLQKFTLLWWNIRDLHLINILPLGFIIISLPFLVHAVKDHPKGESLQNGASSPLPMWLSFRSFPLNRWR